jgi:hypothetical protein
MLHGPELAIDQAAQHLAAAVLNGWLRGLLHPLAATTKLLTVGCCPRGSRMARETAWGQAQQHRYAVLRGVLCAAAPSLPQIPALVAALCGRAQASGGDTNRKVEEQAICDDGAQPG